MRKMNFISYLSVLATLLIITNLMARSGEFRQQQKKRSSPPLVDTIITNISGTGATLTIEFTRGQSHNHPLMAIWVEDTNGQYVQTVYVARSIATGIFNYGDASSGQWTKGEIRRPAALPYWAHKRGIKAEDGLYMPSPSNPVPDAYSGATPKYDFVVNSRMDEPGVKEFFVLLEINQPWDWNEYWTNAKFPGDYEYQTSAQPAVVYRTKVYPDTEQFEFIMEPMGHSHYSGKDGNLYTDLSTLTTALRIAEKIVVKTP